jgi:thiosulfate dehydrogenase (quinone) large subunit
MAIDETSSSSPAPRGIAGGRRPWSSVGGGGESDAARMALVFAGLRIFVGIVWIANLSWKLPPDFGRHDARGLLYSFELAHRWALVGPLRDLVGSVVIPHFTLFGWMVFGIELAAGVFLTLGLMTRLGAVLGTAESVAITLLVGRAPTEWFWGYAMFVLLNAVPLVVRSDARLSVAHARRRA